MTSGPDPAAPRREAPAVEVPTARDEQRMQAPEQRLAHAPAPRDPSAAPSAEQAAVRTVYLEAPRPPRRRGNRVVGVAFALLGSLAFLLLHAVLGSWLVAAFNAPAAGAARVEAYIGSPVLAVPALLFLVGFLVLVLIADRAGWWAYALGGVLVAALVYGGSIGILLLAQGGLLLTPDEAGVLALRLATHPILVVGAVLAREIVLWAGLPIARSGRAVTRRNAEARERFDAEQSERRAALAGEPLV